QSMRDEKRCQRVHLELLADPRDVEFLQTVAPYEDPGVVDEEIDATASRGGDELGDPFFVADVDAVDDLHAELFELRRGRATCAEHVVALLFQKRRESEANPTVCARYD